MDFNTVAGFKVQSIITSHSESMGINLVIFMIKIAEDF